MPVTEHHFNATLTAADAKHHFTHSFEVPVGSTRLEIRLDYPPPTQEGELSNMLTLSLFDPDGARGAGHRGGASHQVVISLAEATPGYRAGRLPPGGWSVVVDAHRVMPDRPCPYTLTVAISDEPVAAAPLPSFGAATIARGPGWYRGDLHAHTIHSDGSWDVPDLVAAARAFQLDFVTLSDHNTVSGLARMDRAQAFDLLTMGGMELTTFWGHALALGLRQWIDWRVQPGQRTMPQIATEVMAVGGLFIIAHPTSLGDPRCTGCDWRYDDMRPGPARLVEVWNGGLWRGDSNNEQALALWYEWLNQGYHLTATAGTDVHGRPPAGVKPGFNVVYAEDLAEAAILAAVGRSHLYLSSGPELILTGRTSSGATGMMGDTLPAEPSRITARWSEGLDGNRLRLIVDGQPLAEQPARQHGKRTWSFTAGQAQWCVVELRAEQGDLLAVTNPIFWQV